MSLKLNLATGQVDVGDSKLLSVTPKTAAGAAAPLAALSAVFTPPTGTATEKDIDDFDLSGGVYSVRHTFDVRGRWKIVVHATDALGNKEAESGYLNVRPL